MPIKSAVVEINTAVGPLRVAARIAVDGPFFGGSSGAPEDDDETARARVLAARIERVVLTAIKEFREDA